MSAVYEFAFKASTTKPKLLLCAPREETRVSRVKAHPSTLSQTNLQIDLLLESIQSPAIVEFVRPIFRDLLRFLDCLDLFKSLFSEFEQAHDTLAMFELVNVEACSVVNNIRRLTTPASGLDESLIEALDGIAFAIAHDLHQVFDGQLKSLPYKAPVEIVVGELSNSHGLLTNCARESIITLARQFDATITADRLFEDSDTRLAESLLLRRDLTDLIELVRSWDETQGEPAAEAIVVRVVKFRHGSMRFLMYRDWKEYEMFSSKITLASTDRAELGPVLDSFACYLETLLRLVSSRSVFSSVPTEPLASELEYMPLAH